MLTDIELHEQPLEITPINIIRMRQCQEVLSLATLTKSCYLNGVLNAPGIVEGSRSSAFKETAVPDSNYRYIKVTAHWLQAMSNDANRKI